MTTPLHHGFRLGRFEIHPGQGEVLGPQGARHAPPRVMELLLCLAEQPGKLVSRDALRERVWGSAAVSEEMITRCVSELRQLLADNPDHPEFIQTIPRRGYRLIVDPVALDARVAEPAAVYDSDELKPEKWLAGLFGDLARRRVFRVGISYLVAAWLLLQVADVTFDSLPLPRGSMTVLIIVLAMGFPVTLVLAWAFEITPGGIMVDRRGGRYDPVAEGARAHPAVFAIAAITAVLVGWGAYVYVKRGEPDEVLAIRAAESIAVLPFRNMSPSSENDYFSDGLTEEILNVLARLGGLKVAARTSSFYFKDKDLDITDIATRLNVSYVLEGSVRREQDAVRVTAQLINGRDGYHIWSQTYDREVEDVFSIQTDIARNVAGTLKIMLSGAANTELERPPTENFEAYDFYLRGLDYLHRPQDETNLENAVMLFQQAIEGDAEFGSAYAGLCNARLAQYELSQATERFEEAERVCHRALTRDQESAELYVALGNLHRLSGEYLQALDEFERAIALDPWRIGAYVGKGRTLGAVERGVEAELTYLEAIALDPARWEAYQALGNFYFGQARYEDAVPQYEQVIARTPENASAYNNYAAAYFMLGDFQSAAEVWLKALDIIPSRGAFANTGTMFFYLGRFGDAAEMYRRGLELTPDDFRLWGNLGDAYSQIPDRRQDAVEAYRKGISLGEASHRINPADGTVASTLASYYASLGEAERARSLIAHALESSPENYYVYYDASLVALRLGEIGPALDALEKAVALGYPARLLSVDAGFTALQDTQRFQRLAAEGVD